MTTDTYEFVSDADEWTLRRDGAPILRVLPRAGATDSFTPIEDGFWLWERVCDEPTDSMRMEIETTFTPDYTMVPGISYDGNGWGDTPEYVGDRAADGTPWTWAWHRCTVPACTYSAATGQAVVLTGALDDAVSCSLTREGDVQRHSLLWPEVEGPQVLHRHFWKDAYEGSMEPRRTFQAIIGGFAVDRPHLDYAPLLDFAFRYYGHAVREPFGPQRLYELSIAYTKFLWSKEADGFISINRGCGWHDDITAFGKARISKYEIGWVGQSALLSLALLEEYLRSGDEDARDKALSVLDHWCRFALPNGMIRIKFSLSPEQDGVLESAVEKREQSKQPGKELPYEEYHPEFVTGADGKRIFPIDACNLGGAAEHLLSAYELAERIDMPRPEYKRVALGICDFARREQKPNGQFAKAWNPDGSVFREGGTVGCFLVPALLKAYEVTGEDEYLHSAMRAFDFYYGELLRDGYTTAGALDTYCIDKESSSPLLISALRLYRLTGDRRFVEAAETTAWYLSTWMMHFTVQYPHGSLLHEVGIDTFGMTSVSTAHTAVDQYSLHDVLSFFELAEVTGDDQWRERALALWVGASQSISDGTLAVRGRVRPAGSQDEAIFHTRWGRPVVTEFHPCEWLPAWPTAFRLEVLQTLEDWTELERGLDVIDGSIQPEPLGEPIAPLGVSDH
ncbi:hypothetical protein IF188_00575 [Microbacterium sp. NEAU-LLC]|uniref:Uncharacterized protein n=1 Tax=Microbacterium helvum TaxID=2773713 RepID=A0ABR8NK75_9MICO|nr:hypothetical protein [Microbacterium helvum]MBD3940192.1 hypothetical protein [Microbacterium helvum]